MENDNYFKAIAETPCCDLINEGWCIGASYEGSEENWSCDDCRGE